VAQVDFQVIVDDEAALRDVTRRYGGFLGPPAARPRVLDCRGARRALDPLPAERLQLAGGVLTTSSGSAWGLLDRATGRGHVLPHPGMKVLDMVVRAEVTLAALEAGGVALHASAVGLGEGGVLFSGRSGAGKSTVARQLAAEGGLVVCEDLAVLRPDRDGGWCVHGTPFGEGAPRRVRLVRTLALERGPRGVRAVTPGQSARHLARNLALCVEDQATVGAALAGVTALARAVPAGVLTWHLGETVRPALGL
jgi:hypothetical protein